MTEEVVERDFKHELLFSFQAQAVRPTLTIVTMTTVIMGPVLMASTSLHVTVTRVTRVSSVPLRSTNVSDTGLVRMVQCVQIL